MKFNKRSMSAMAVGVLTTWSMANAADLFVYPPNGRSQTQQQQDQFECHQWAVEQSKFDPVQVATQTTSSPSASTAQPQSSNQPRTGQAVVGGAAQGAIIGEVAGDKAGKGAAAGATMGLLRGRMAERQAAEERAMAQAQAQQKAKQQQTAQADELRAKQQSYQRARGTCFKARGYTVSDG